MKDKEQLAKEYARKVCTSEVQHMVIEKDFLAGYAAAQQAADKDGKPFKMPRFTQLLDVAILFNEGKVESEKLSEMVGMCQFVLDRLFENGDISKPTKKEQADAPDLTAPEK